MENEERFLQRIDYEGSFPDLILKICEDYNLGRFDSYQVIPFGYEDLNVGVYTDKGKHLAKLFSSFRSIDDCRRYIGIIEQILAAGVSHPRLYTAFGSDLFQSRMDGTGIRACVMEYVEGSNFFELGEKPTQEEGELLIEQVAKVNSIQYKPPFMYDSWAVSNIAAEFDIKKDALTAEDRDAITPIVDQFRSLPIESLPHALVHGDIISTNVMKDKSGKLYIIDFSVANWYPRIQELAVLLCDLFFDPTDQKRFMETYDWTIAEYQKHILLTPEELKALPVFARAAHAMHIIGASFEKSQGNTEEENNSWLELGRRGLLLSPQLKSKD